MATGELTPFNVYYRHIGRAIKRDQKGNLIGLSDQKERDTHMIRKPFAKSLHIIFLYYPFADRGLSNLGSNSSNVKVCKTLRRQFTTD